MITVVFQAQFQRSEKFEFSKRRRDNICRTIIAKFSSGRNDRDQRSARSMVLAKRQEIQMRHCRYNIMCYNIMTKRSRSKTVEGQGTGSFNGIIL